MSGSQEKVSDTFLAITKSSILVEALPYIKCFYGKVFVIKTGGSILTHPEHCQRLMQDIALLYFCGIRVVLVHGGGPEITAMCQRLSLSATFVKGQRVTDLDTLEVVQMVLLGKTNQALVTALNQSGIKAIGLSGQDGGFLQVQKHSLEKDLGYVGEIKDIDTGLIDLLLEKGFVPVIAPIGVDIQGQAYNINADSAAGAIAGKLKADKLLILSDVNGVYSTPHDPNTRLSTLSKTTVKTWLEKGKIEGGMVPKLHASLQALDAGVNSVQILDGKIPHSLLLEIFTDSGIGTQITQD